MSYLYRIKSKDKYLLIKNSKWNFYQLVGGKYKKLAESKSFLHQLNAVDDRKMPTHGLHKDDFAFFMPAKNAVKFLDWFNKTRDKEISHWREFYEELIKPRILSRENFPYINYHHVGTITTPLKENSSWDCLEILQYDILDLIPTKEQEKELLELLEKGDTDEIKWATDQMIQLRGFCQNDSDWKYRIGKHTKWAINLKWSKESSHD